MDTTTFADERLEHRVGAVVEQGADGYAGRPLLVSVVSAPYRLVRGEPLELGRAY